MFRKGPVVALASIAAGALLRNRKAAPLRERRSEQRSVEKQLHQYTLYVAAPVWIAAGLLDYLWHRKTRIETTTGPQESWLHLLMLTEAAPIALAPLLFEINAGVLLLMAGMFVAHEATAAWDVGMTAPRRLIETTEQHIHSVLEMMPFSVASLYLAAHWNKLRAILHHPGADDLRLRLKQSRASTAQVAGLVSAITVFDFLPHAEELWRCWNAQQKGLTGRDSPACAAVLYGKKRND
jgi:hypothetical protein